MREHSTMRPLKVEDFEQGGPCRLLRLQIVQKSLRRNREKVEAAVVEVVAVVVVVEEVAELHGPLVVLLAREL